VNKIIRFLKDEFNSYSINMKITLGILFAFVGGFALFGLQILFFGLGYTDMNTNFAMGIWIVMDLTLVALGGGAFTTGFILYILRKDELKPIINSCVLVGFLCYLFTLVFLVFDIGQPIRGWFGFAYPNWGNRLMPNSMLTEVIFCLSFYFMVLTIELIPIILEHKEIDKNPIIHKITHYMHEFMWIMAAVGTFLSFFHQGSLGGGMWGVLFGKPAWFRPHFFFLAIVAATAGGTSLMAGIAYIAGKVKKKDVVPKSALHSLTKISGIMFIGYMIFRIYDIYTMTTHFVPAADRSFTDLWGGYYGIWMLALELMCCMVPIVLLNIKKFREQEKFMLIGIGGGVAGITISKLIIIFHGFSTPNFPWRSFATYNPSIQEWAITFGGVASMILIYMFFARYLPLFPHLDENENH